MSIKFFRRVIAKLVLIIVLTAAIFSIPPGPAISSVQSVAKAPSTVIQAPFTLHGTVKNQIGNPVQANIYVTDKLNNPLANLLTDANGDYSVTIPVHQDMVVNAFPLGLPENLIALPGDFHILKYFELTKGIMPASDSVEVSFALPPAAVLQLDAFNPAGSLMNFDAVYAALNPTEYYGYSGAYGVFPMSSMGLPVPEGPSIGMFRWAWPPDNTRSLWRPCFGTPPGEPVYIMMLWEVPGIGTFPLRADNQGLGYTLSEGGVRKINLVYEFAETEYRRALELKARLEGEGHQFSSGLLDILSQANAALLQARGQSEEQGRALNSYEVLRLSIKAKEQMTVEAAEADIPMRQAQFKVVVQDPAGKPVPGVAVTYHQDQLDFVLTYGQGAPFNPFPYPSYLAGVETGYQTLQGIIVWKQVSPQEGVFDFSAVDAMFQQWQGMGYDVIADLAWLGSDNVPAWAQNLDFAEFQQQMGLFVRKAVEHYTGTVKYMYVATEINLQTTTGSRYISVAYPSNYLTGMQPADLIELIRTAFQAGREAHSDMLLGYYGISDYIYNQLNPLPWGAWPPSYSFLKSVLDAGVQPDYIGVELFPGTLGIPQDLSNVAETLKAYHDLSGLPVMVAESVAYSSRAEDYGEIGPTPHIYWHEGPTQSAQAEWETSFFKIAMSQPDVLGVNMFRGFPDNPQRDPGQPLGDCMGVMACIGNGTDSLTQEFQPKQVYYAMQALIASWKTNGSGVTDAQGEVSFTGLSGTYSIGVTTPNSLFQSFERQLNQASSVVTLTLDSPQAILDLRQRLARAQKEVDWSAQLGRLLDYTQLRSQLAAARIALSGGDYASARSLIDQVLEAATIKIDGGAADWQGIAPILTALPGGVQVNAPGIDLKALYGMFDDEYLYLLVEVYDPPIILQPGWEGGIKYPGFTFDLYNGSGEHYAFGAYLPYHGQINLFRVTDPFHFIGTYYSIAYHNALELKIPLALLDNPSQLSVCSFVSALENGAGKVAKAFDGCAWVLHPFPSIFLPMVKR